MTRERIRLVVSGSFAVIVLGALLSPYIRNRFERSVPVSSAPPPVEQAASSASTSGGSGPAAPGSSAVGSRSLKRQNRARVMSFIPELEQRLQPLLNRGANMAVASDGFQSAEQFATVAHAARNTDVPFMVLKHAVVDDRESLAAAIHTFKPNVDAPSQANLARAEARADLASAQLEFASSIPEWDIGSKDAQVPS